MNITKDTTLGEIKVLLEKELKGERVDLSLIDKMLYWSSSDPNIYGWHSLYCNNGGKITYTVEGPLTILREALNELFDKEWGCWPYLKISSTKISWYVSLNSEKPILEFKFKKVKKTFTLPPNSTGYIYSDVEVSQPLSLTLQDILDLATSFINIKKDEDIIKAEEFSREIRHYGFSSVKELENLYRKYISLPYSVQEKLK